VTELWATRFPPPKVPGKPSQRDALNRIVGTLDLHECARAVLHVLCDQADGAGIAYPKTATLVRLSGCKRAAVYVALTELKAAELVERYPTIRDPDDPRLARRRNPRARHGQGPTVTVLGRALRVAAGLRDLNMSEHLGLVPAGAQNRSTGLPKTERKASAGAGLRPVSGEQLPHGGSSDADDGGSAEGEWTPRMDSLNRDETPAYQGVQRESHWTPKNLGTEERLTETSTVGAKAPTRDVDDEATKEDDVTNRIIAFALARTTEQPSPFVSPLAAPLTEPLVAVRLGDEGYVAFLKALHRLDVLDHAELLAWLALHGATMRGTLPPLCSDSAALDALARELSRENGSAEQEVSVSQQPPGAASAQLTAW